MVAQGLHGGQIQLPGIGQEITFIGQGDRAEIWDTATYQKLEEEMLTPENLKAAMEELNF